MKNFFVFLFVVIIVVFTSCQKEEIVIPVNIETIRAQLVEFPVPSKEEVQSKISEQNSLKSASNESVTLTRIFPLEEWTYEINDNYANKYLIYYELNKDGYREKLLTIRQEFQIVDGEIDESGYGLEISIGCPFSKIFYVNNRDYLNQITVFFHFNDGAEFAYYLDRSYLGEVKLPPIADGKWQLSVTYDDGDMRQSFMSNLIDWNNESITLKFNIKSSSNVHLKINREYLKDATLIQVVGKDENGNFQYFLIPINGEGFDEIIALFDLPFQINRIYICGDSGCRYYHIGDDFDMVIEILTGVIYYRLL